MDTKKQCQAWSESTNSRCSKRALRASRYCWWHEPKGLLLFSLLAGALLGLAVQELYQLVVPSAEQKELASLRTETAKWQKAFDEAQKELIAAQYGEGTFGYLAPSLYLYRGEGGELGFDIVKEGKWPLKDVTLTIEDLSYVEELDKIPTSKRNQVVQPFRTKRYLPVVTLPRTQIDHAISLKGKQVIQLRIEISTANGAWIERLTLRYINGLWLSAIEVMWHSVVVVTSQGGIPLTKLGIVFQDVAPSFPHTADGKPQW